MGKRELSQRNIWQDVSGKNAKKSEDLFYRLFLSYLQNTQYRIINKPKEFKTIYVDFLLSTKDSQEIYNPKQKITRHGISPDFAILNVKTQKTIYIEIKRQDGWIENTTRQAGRGNAHERMCKYFTPGLLKILRNKSKINAGLPFWIIFFGNITRDPCRVREITCWFDNYHHNFYFWRDAQNPIDIIEHFDNHIKSLLD